MRSPLGLTQVHGLQPSCPATQGRTHKAAAGTVTCPDVDVPMDGASAKAIGGAGRGPSYTTLDRPVPCTSRAHGMPPCPPRTTLSAPPLQTVRPDLHAYAPCRTTKVTRVQLWPCALAKARS